MPSCIEEIDLQVPAGLSNNVVIQGRVIFGEEPRVEVLLGRLFDFSADSRQLLNVRKVVLIDEIGTELEVELTSNGFYTTPLDSSSAIQACIGCSYKLRATTFDDRTYESSFDAIHENMAPSSLDLSIIQDFQINPIGNRVLVDLIQISINTQIHENSAGLYFELENTYKLTDTPIFPNIEMKTCYLRKPANNTVLPVISKEELVRQELSNDIYKRRYFSSDQGGKTGVMP